MKFKKQIGIIISCIAILAVVFFAVNYIGNRDKAASNKNDSNVAETGSNTNDKNQEDGIADNSSKDDTDTASKAKDENVQNEDDSKISEGIKEGYYTVKETDTLFNIARTYMPNSDPDKVVEAIKERNELKDNVISNGQKLIISYETALENGSNSSKDNTTSNGDHTNHMDYVVKEGDTLFNIATKYMSSMNVMDGIETIKSHNNMGDSTVIKVDQTICIPSSEQ